MCGHGDRKRAGAAGRSNSPKEPSKWKRKYSIDLGARGAVGGGNGREELPDRVRPGDSTPTVSDVDALRFGVMCVRESTWCDRDLERRRHGLHDA
jgi:hypothetical protein